MKEVHVTAGFDSQFGDTVIVSYDSDDETKDTVQVEIRNYQFYFTKDEAETLAALLNMHVRGFDVLGLATVPDDRHEAFPLTDKDN